VFVVVTGAAGGSVLLHGILTGSPLVAVVGLAIMSFCIGLVAARLSRP
jgi:hypothetical protein